MTDLDKTCDECGRKFSGAPYSATVAWQYQFHVDANSVDGLLGVRVVFEGEVRAGTLTRLVETYIQLCPACVAAALEVALRAIKKLAIEEGLGSLSRPEPEPVIPLSGGDLYDRLLAGASEPAAAPKPTPAYDCEPEFGTGSNGRGR